MVEKRQEKLAKNGEAMERAQRKLFRIVHQLEKLAQERKRLLHPKARGGKLRNYDIPMGYSVGAADPSLNDDIPIL